MIVASASIPSSLARRPTIAAGEGFLPPWVEALSLGEWTEIANTQLSTIEQSPYPGGNGPEMKINAWNSLVVDPEYSNVYTVANGGHNDYNGNEVDRFELNRSVPRVINVLPTTPVGQMTDCQSYYSDGRPAARHSYYGVTFEPVNRRIMLFGGAHKCINGGFHSAISSYNIDSNAYSSSSLHGSWSGSEGERGVAADPVTGNVYVFDNNAVRRWVPASGGGGGTWTANLSASGSPPSANGCASAFDTLRGRAFCLGTDGSSNAQHTYTVSTNAVASVTLTGAASGSVKGYEYGMVYVPEIDAYLVRTNAAGGTVYRIDAGSFNCTTFSTTGGGSILSAINGTFNRFVYVPNLRGCFLLPRYASNGWFLRVH